MKRQNIQFKGLRHSPSDITGQDGDLLECVNLIHENGELKPIEMPEKTVMRGYGKDENVYILVAVHNLTDGKKFVFARFDGTNTNIIVKRDGQTAVFYDHAIMGEEIQWAETIGNTLIIGTDKSTHYAFYKNGAYKWLGDKLPQPIFEFDFTRESVQVDGQYNGHYINEYDPKMYTLLPDGEPIPGGGVALSVSASSTWVMPGYETTESLRLSNTTNENKKIFRDGIQARHAQVMHTANHANVFVYPFLIRYAVRMFDNKYAMHSAPILMIPSSLTNPLLAVLGIYSYGDYVHSGQHDSNNVMYTIAHENMQFKGMNLKYKFKGFADENGNIVSASDWEDIIKGVDLFFSSQIYSYDEHGWDDLNSVPTTFKVFHQDNNNIDFGCCYSQNKKMNWWDIYTDETDGNPIFDYDEMCRWYYNNSQYHNTYRYLKIPLPTISKKAMMERIKETNLFYRVKQYDLTELETSDWTTYRRFAHEADTAVLNRLETLPTLPDDYVSRCRINGKVNYNYNQRLLLGNIKLQAPRWYQDAKRFEKSIFVDMCFVIEKPEKTIYVRWDSETNNLGNNDFGHYIYYPDPDCKKVIVRVTQFMSQTGRKRVIPMHEHTGLNGAYALMPDLKSLDAATASTDFEVYNDDLPSESSDRYYQQPNTIAMSSVANPFHFPASNFKDIGRTKVVGIAANTLDVSSGQWGQYPLYVFCSDGIIAIIIDGDGKFGGIQAVSADVLREPRGLSQPTLVQTGQALMFLTQRGVMAIGGTQIKCLSEVMNGRHFNPMSELANVDYHVGAFANLIGRTSDDTDFRDFAASGFLAFDYAHNRVLMLRSDRDYQYVYSLNTGFWSKQIIYTNLDSFQIEVVPGNGLPAQRSGGVPLLQVKPMLAAVNNYTEMYLQDEDGWLYKTMEVQGQNSVKQLYQYGYIVSRPIRFGTDEYKTVVNALHRFNHYAKKSFVKLAMYGSRDGVKYGRINSLRGMSYQYFIFVIYTYLKPNERYSYLTVDFETRLTNKLR